MKKLLLVALAFAPFCMIAQPTLTSGSINPTVGDSIYLLQADSTYKNGPSGASQTWDYSNMTGYSDTNDYWVHFLSPSTQPDYQYATIKNYSTVAQVPPTFKGGNAYMSVKNDTIWLQGYSVNVQGMGSVVMEMDVKQAYTMVYPFTYTNSFSNTYSGTLHSTLGTYPFSGAINVAADGYGSLKMPWNSAIPNVLRVMSYDSTEANAGLLGTFTFTNTRYDYYEPNLSMPGVDPKYPILSFATSGLNGATSSWVTTQISVIASVTEFNLANDMKTYPNPASNMAYFEYNLQQDAQVNINLVDAKGRIIKPVYEGKTNFGMHKVSINTSGLAAGLYLIKIDVDNQTTIRKLTIQ